MKALWTWLSKPRLLNFGVAKEEKTPISAKQIIGRIIVSIITASWIGCIPFYFFTIYMYENHFFSYDFFIDGIIGLYTFTLVSALFLIICSVSFYGFIILAKLGITEQRQTGKNSMRFLTWLMFIVSCTMHYAFFIMALSGNKLHVLLWIMMISGIFCSLIYSFAGHNFRKNIQNYLSPLAFIGLSIFLPFAYQDATSEVVAMGLRSFNVGGGKTIEITQVVPKENTKITGALLLLSPKNAYIKNKEHKLSIIPISSNTKVSIW